MASLKNFFISTTHSCEGRQIIDYLGVVTAHVVAGTGIFSDIVASFSDIFGGRSKSYQNQISSIYTEVINQLKSKAQLLGANGLIGLKIDIDEISGKAKQMFMVTATGTAVYLEPDKKTISENRTSKYITAEELKLQLDKTVILENAKHHKLEFTEKTYDFLIQNKVGEILPIIFKEINRNIENNTTFNNDTHVKYAKELFNNLQDEDKKKYVYDALNSSLTSIRSLLYEFIKESFLLDFDEVIKMLKHDNFEVQKVGLQLLKYFKSHYEKKDINTIQEIIELIKLKFPERGTKFSKKGALSSKESKFWKCECGNDNKVENEFCTKCSLNIYGFANGEINPEKAIKILTSNLLELKKLFNESE